jgi:chorismate synthase
MLRFLTAGESHGPALVVILEGLPAGLPVSVEAIDEQLRRRQAGHGRGGRMQIERDRVRVVAGLRFGRTLGSPLALLLENRDWPNWEEKMAVEAEPSDPPARATVPRPGHADLAGAGKYGFSDIRNVIERASARETAARVAAGAVARQLLAQFGVAIYGHVLSIGEVEAPPPTAEWPEVAARAEASPVRCADPGASAAMVAAIDAAREAGDTLGGVFQIVVTGLPVGLGSYVHWDRRLDGLLGQALLSIPAIKGVEVGLGFRAAGRRGSEVHDEILASPAPGGPPRRPTNRAGGLEGGVTNGEPLLLQAAMKPISTLARPLRSIDLATGAETTAPVERADVCAAPAAAVVGEAVVALVLAPALQEKRGGDSLDEMKRHAAS